jgi:hypothetical protein
MPSGSATPEPRRTSRRDSSPRNAGRRPRLLRASATEPSITTSNASRNALCNSQSSRRALDMLSRVAIVSGSPPSSVMRSITPISSPPLSPTYSQQGDLSTSPLGHDQSLEKIRPHHCTSRFPQLCPFVDRIVDIQQTADAITVFQASTFTKLNGKMRRRSQRSLLDMNGGPCSCHLRRKESGSSFNTSAKASRFVTYGRVDLAVDEEPASDPA